MPCEESLNKAAERIDKAATNLDRASTTNPLGNVRPSNNTAQQNMGPSPYRDVLIRAPALTRGKSKVKW